MVPSSLLPKFVSWANIRVSSLTMTNNVFAAIDYADMGWNVFPLTPNKKIPMPHSRGFKDATSDHTKIGKWWRETPNANIGIATGAASGLWVIDIDMKNERDGLESLEEFVKSHDPKAKKLNTKVVHTPSGGIHYYIKYDPERPVGNRSNIVPGVDVRGDGGYVVAPPSITDIGQYQWEDVSVDVADGPDWAYALYEHDTKSITGLHSDRPNKIDPANKLPWDMVLQVQGNRRISLEDTTVGQKYICRCPFHDDRSASAAFWRKEVGFGYLWCSACETTWTTEKKILDKVRLSTLQKRMINLQQLIKGEK